jgi:hypothetical protein
MGLYKTVRSTFNFRKLDEAIDAFKTKGDLLSDKQLIARRGEGFEQFPFESFGLTTFNQFYRRFINRIFQNETAKIKNYRAMAAMPEIADVIEDAVIESCQPNSDGKIITLDIQDPKLEKNSAAKQLLESEFDDFFFKKVKVQKHIDGLFRTFLIDGRVYYERLIDQNNKKAGIVGIKPLPTETMDFEYDYQTGKVRRYLQYLTPQSQRTQNPDQAISRKEAIEFLPEQVGYIDYGIYGRTKNEVFGYLEKVKIPYNQLKLLETSVVIYRLIRAPERLVFKIDVGNMPKDKAKKYVEEIKLKFQKRQSYDVTTGRLLNEPNVVSVLENFFIAQGADGKGSSIESVGGASTAGFTDLNDIYYFQRKLYQSLKYPASRVTTSQERRESEGLFLRSPAGEISRDEVKWATFLEKQQLRFCEELAKLFLLHLDFKEIKQNYKLSHENIVVMMTQPSYFRDRQKQIMLETRMANYTTLTALPEMSKSYCMKKYLDWDEEEIKENSAGLKEDKKLGFAIQPDDGFGGGGGFDSRAPGDDTGDDTGDTGAPKKKFMFPRKKKSDQSTDTGKGPEADSDKEENLVLNG